MKIYKQNKERVKARHESSYLKPQKVFVLSLFVAGSFLFANSVEAATYYIDPTCATPGNGTSPTCAGGASDPFAHWSDVTWTAGNTYLQKGGTIAREQVTIGATGTAGNVITLGSYGTGKGIIQPTTNLTSWTQSSGNIYYATLAADPRSVFINGTLVQPAHWPTSVGAATPVFENPSANSADSTHLTDSALAGRLDTDLIGTELYLYTNNFTQKPVAVSAFNTLTNILTIGDVISAPTTAMRYYLIAKSGAGIPFSSKSWMMTENSWFYDTDASRLYVWQLGGGTPTSVEASNQSIGILSTNRDYITIQDLIVRYARMVDENGQSFSSIGGIVINNTVAHSNITIQRVDVSYAGYAAISVANSGATGLLIDSCTIDHAIYGIRVATSVGTISNNTITNTGGIYPSLPGKGSAVLAFQGSGPITISGNTINHSGYMGINNTNTGASISGNTVSNTSSFLVDSAGIYTFGTVTGTGLISGNTLTNAGNGIYFDTGAVNWTAANNTVTGGLLGSLIHQGTTISILRNTFIGPFAYPGGQDAAIYLNDTVPSSHTIAYNVVNSAGSSYGIYTNSSLATAGVNVYNNTFLNAGIAISMQNAATSFGSVMNNIFYNDTTHIKSYPGAFTSINNNLFYGSGNWIYGGTTYSTFGTWKTVSSQDSHSINSDPLFISSSDLHLGTLSPSIGSGIVVGGLTNDNSGNPFYGTPDIGAYEYQPPFKIGTSPIDPSGSIRIYGDGQYRYTTSTSSSMAANLSATPIGGSWTYDASTTRPEWLNISNITWGTSKQWTASSSLATTTIFTVGDLAPNARYTVSVDSVPGNNITGPTCSSGVCTAGSDGKLTLTYTGGYTTHTFTVSPAPTTVNIMPGGSVSSSVLTSILVPSASTTSYINSLGSPVPGCPASFICTPILPTTALASYKFNRSLKQGMSGTDVKQLQIFLNAQGFIVSNTGGGSLGHETTYFGPATKSALMRFQSAHSKEILEPQGLAFPTGFFGEGTRGVVNGR